MVLKPGQQLTDDSKAAVKESSMTQEKILNVVGISSYSIQYPSQIDVIINPPNIDHLGQHTIFLLLDEGILAIVEDLVVVGLGEADELAVIYKSGHHSLVIHHLHHWLNSEAVIFLPSTTLTPPLMMMIQLSNPSPSFIKIVSALSTTTIMANMLY